MSRRLDTRNAVLSVRRDGRSLHRQTHPCRLCWPLSSTSLAGYAGAVGVGEQACLIPIQARSLPPPEQQSPPHCRQRLGVANRTIAATSFMRCVDSDSFDLSFL